MSGTENGAAEGSRRPPVEQRAEDVMRRVSSDVSRFLTRFAGRAREEVEDIVAEAKTVKEQWGTEERG